MCDASELAELRGQLKAYRELLAAHAAADDHRRVELDAARAEAAGAHAAIRVAQAQADELHRRLVVAHKLAVKDADGSDVLLVRRSM